MSIVFKDAFHGEGGSYVLDIKTGLRTRTGQPAAVPADAQEAEIGRVKAELATAEADLARVTKGSK